MRLALVEVYEVASFYAHFDIVMDGEPAPPPVTVRVCDSLTCAMMGAERLLAELKGSLEPSVRVVRAPCMGGCHNAPVAAIGHALHEHASVESVTKAVANGETHPHLPGFIDFDRYRAEGGYELLADCLDRQAPGRRHHQDRSRIRTCAASAARASRPGASGASCAPSPRRG